MVHMRHLAVCAFAALLGGCIVQFEVSDEYVETFEVEGQTLLKFAGFNGDVEFRGLSTSLVKLRGTRTAVGSTKQAAKDALRHARLDISFAGAETRLQFDPPLRYVGLVDIELDKVSTVPQEASVSLSLDEGDIYMDGVNGDLELKTGRGEVVVLDAMGTVSAVAEGGSVEIESAGAIYAETSRDARVSALGQSENTVQVSTRGGALNFEIASQDFEIICQAGTGEIEISQQLQVQQENLEDGTVVFTSGTGARLVNLSSGGGDISIDAIEL